jgi:hypothetical protein
MKHLDHNRKQIVVTENNQKTVEMPSAAGCSVSIFEIFTLI